MARASSDRARAGAVPGRRSFDLATLIGLAAALALIATAIVMGGRAEAFLDPAALTIVLGGTTAVTLVSFSLGELLQTPHILRKAVQAERQSAVEVVARLVAVAELARREGLMRLDAGLPAHGDRPLLQRGLIMVVDGLPEAEIENALGHELDAMLRRHEQSGGLLRRAAETAPAMGLIGTLIGLVQMLGRLEDPASIGPAMAVALLTTLYGAILSHMLLTPLAVKLERASAAEALFGEMELLTVLAVRRRLHPRQLESMLNGLLPPRQRQERLG
jgi:chemotaxis protein MotA